MIIYNEKIFENKFDKSEIITGFINEDGNHWTLMYAELKTNRVFYIDPQGEKKLRQEKFMKNWKYFDTILKFSKLNFL